MSLPLTWTLHRRPLPPMLSPTCPRLTPSCVSPPTTCPPLIITCRDKCHKSHSYSVLPFSSGKVHYSLRLGPDGQAQAGDMIEFVACMLTLGLRRGTWEETLFGGSTFISFGYSFKYTAWWPFLQGRAWSIAVLSITGLPGSLGHYGRDRCDFHRSATFIKAYSWLVRFLSCFVPWIFCCNRTPDDL